MKKLNFKKIASVIAGTVMMSSTLAFAAAANYPAPFVQNGNADVAIVYGSQAGAEFDLVAVADVTSNLQAALAAQTASTGSTSGSSSISGGDYVKLERSSDKFNLGESANDFYSSLDDDELSMVLADGIYQNDDNNEFDFTQKIELNSSLVLEHFQDSDFNDDKPIIGFNLADGDHVLTYTLDFTPDAVEGGANFVDLETTDLTLLGRTYYIVQAQNVSGKPKLTLLDSANSAIITEGESSSITVGSKTYTVAINFIDSDETILTVDGVQTNKLQEGDVFKVAEDTYVAVKNVLYDSKDTGISKAEISIGSGKIVLQDGQEVKINNEDVSDITEYNDAELVTYVTMNSDQELDKISLSWTLGDDTFVAAGSELVLPGFETIKVSMGAFNTPNKEMTTVENDGDDSIKLTTYVEDGKVSFNILQANASGFHLIGKDSNKRLVTQNETIKQFDFDTDTDEWFVASWINGDDAESYVLTVSDISSSDVSKNTTTVKSVATGSSLARDLDIGESEDFGRVRLKLNRSNDNSNNATFTISAAGGSGSVYLDKVYTKEGLRIQLPVSGNTSANPGQINLTTTNSSFILRFTEEDEDGNVASGANFNATLGLNSDSDAHVSSVTVVDYETEDGSDNYEGYVNSSIATKTLYKTSGDQDTLEIEYHGEESFADVYVAESGAAVEAGSGVVSSGSVKELGSILVKDSEVSSVANKNLIVVGGSCVNNLAKELLGNAGCGSDFTAATGVGSGSFLVQTFSRSSGKIATLVAGYNAADTQNAAKVLTTPGKVDVAAGKKYVSTSATTVELQTTQSA